MSQTREITLDERKLLELVEKSRRVRENVENPNFTISKDTLEFNGKVKIPGLSKKITITVKKEDFDPSTGVVKFEIKEIKPSFFGLSKKILSIIPPNRYLEVEKSKFLHANLKNILSRVKFVESEDFSVEDVKIDPGKITIIVKE